MFRKGKDLIVNDKSFWEVQSFQKTEIFDNNVLSFVRYRPCVLSEKSVLDKSSTRIDPIQDWIGVPVVSSGENSHLKMLIHKF